MQRTTVIFSRPFQIELGNETLPELQPGQVLVRSICSAISPGTEMLIYRGQFPEHVALDENISALSSMPSYPFKYGYSLVGKIVQCGKGVPSVWDGKLVFAFHPHESAFITTPQELLAVPDGINSEQAVFLPNMETAVNFLMDGAPLIGEHVAVLGQGIVGLLTTALLARFPLGRLVTLDRYPLRRDMSLAVGAFTSLDPAATDLLDQMQALFPGGADLVYELSGAPEALDLALSLAGYDGRVIIGSWYGQKRSTLNLGGNFHRSRIKLISSQVSSIAPGLSGRWSKERRFEVAWEMLRQVDVERFITQRIPVAQVGQAYQLIDQQPDQTIQVLLTYEDAPV